jgi:hypothetical protein
MRSRNDRLAKLPLGTREVKRSRSLRLDDAPVKVLLPGHFEVRMAAECHSERGVEFPARKNSARKLPRRRVLQRPAKASVAVAGAARWPTMEPFPNGGYLSRLKPETAGRLDEAFQTAVLQSADTQATFVDAVNVAACSLTNSCILSGRCPVSVSTSFDIRS